MNRCSILVLGIFVVLLFGFLPAAEAAIIISSCGQNVDAPGSYLLNQSITSTSDCLTTNSSNVEIDCAGNTIVYGTAGTASSFGITASHSAASQVNLTIKNCIIMKPSAVGASGRGISLTRFANSTIVNNTIMTNGTSSNMGIYIITGSDGNNLSRNTIITSGTSTTNYGISLNAGSVNTNVEYNNITTGRGTATTDNYGIYASDPRANIAHNIINTFGSGDSNYGVYSTGSTGTRIINNTIYTSGTTGNNRGIFLSSSDSNYIANNTVNTTGQASAGIYLSAAGAVNVLNNRIDSSADAIYMTSSTLGDFILANITRDNTRFGRNVTVYGGGALNLPCPNNTVINNPEDGALKFFGCSNITIQNWYRPNRDTDGLLFVNSDDNKIVNNTINGGINGLDMVNTAGLCDNNLIVNNTFSSFGYIDGYAIRVYGTYNVISGNNLSTSGVTSGNNAINIQNDFNNITNNIISTGGTSGNIGINLETGAINNLIQNNSISTSGTSGNTGIYLVSTCTGNIIRNNTIIATGTTSGNLGMRLVTNSNGNLIEYNRFYTRGLTSGNNGLDLSSSSNNIFRFNEVYAGYGAGTTDNDAISSVSSRNNTFANNLLFANGTATSLTSASIFLQSNSANNTFMNNIILKSNGNAIELDFLTTYPHGNVFQNNSLNNVSGSDLFFLDASINNTRFVNQPIGKYNFTGIGGTISVENIQFGKIVFASPISGNNGNLTDDVQMRFNFAQVNSSKPGLNATANVTFYNLSTNLYNPLIKRDGVYECNATTTPACVNFTSLNAGNVSFSVSGWSNYSVVSGPDIIFPNINIISPQNITYSTSSVFLNYSVSDNLAVSNCWYAIDTSSNISLPACSTASISGLVDGSHSVFVYVNDTSGNTNSSSVSFSVSSNPPTWSDMQSSTPLEYSVTNSFFNITWTSANSIQSVLLESNFSGADRNYSMYSLGSGVYGFNTSLPAGTFYWRSYANDSFGNSNFSSTQEFTIAKTNNNLILRLNGTASNLEINYGSPVNVSATSGISGDGDVVYSLYRNGNLVGNGKPISETKILGVGNYIYSYNSSSGQNYSSSSVSYILTVNKTTPALSLFINGAEDNSTQIYGTESNVTSNITGDLEFDLFRNGEIVDNGESYLEEIKILRVGFYNYTAAFVGNENYSEISKSYFLNVTKAEPELSLLFNGGSAPASISLGNSLEVNASSITPSGENVELYEEDAFVDSGVEISYQKNYVTIGERIWKVSFAGNENYSAFNLSGSVTVLDQNVPVYSGLKQSPSSPATYSPGRRYEFNSTWTDNVEVTNVTFSFNATNYSSDNGQINQNGNEYSISLTDLAVGNYSYRWYGEDGSGNLVASPLQYYVVNRASAVLFLTMIPGFSVSYGSETSVGCSSNNAESITNLNRSSTVVGNPDNATLLSPGVYNYLCFSSATQNYTSSSASGILIMNKASPVISLILNGQSSDINFPAGGGSVVVNASLVKPSEGFINVTTDEGIVLGYDLNRVENVTLFSSSGIHTVSVFYYGNENYTSGSFSRIVNVASSSGGSTDSGGSPGSSGSSGGGAPPKSYNSSTELRIDFSDFPSAGIKRGTTSNVVLTLISRERVFLNNCGLRFSGTASSWMRNSQSEGLSQGEKVPYSISVSVPENTEPGRYSANILVQCDEGRADKEVSLNAYRNNFEAEILNYEKVDNQLTVSYSLREYENIEHSISLDYAFIDLDNFTRYDGNIQVSLAPQETKQEKLSFDLPKDSFGEFIFEMRFNDGLSEVVATKEIFLPSQKGLAGLVISSETRRKLSIFGLVVVAALFAVFAFWTAHHYRRKSKKAEVMAHLKNIHRRNHFTPIQVN